MTTMKYEAYQVVPENQESPYMLHGFIYEKCMLMSYVDRPPRLIVSDFLASELPVWKLADEDWRRMANLYYEYDTSDWTPETFMEEWGNEHPLTERQAGTLLGIMQEYGKYWDRYTEAVVNILNVLDESSSNEWISVDLCGSCQGDCAELICVKDSAAYQDRDVIEADFFNEGSEWRICDPETNEEFYGYIYSWKEEDIKKDILSMLPAGSEVVLYEFDGWNRTPRYKVVE